MCNSLEEGNLCDETHAGELKECMPDTAVGCKITQGDDFDI